MTRPTAPCRASSGDAATPSASSGYVHEDAEYNLRTTPAERATGAGDRFLTDDAPILLRGVPVVAPPALAEADGVGNMTASGLLTHPSNVVLGIQRAIQIESDRLIRKRIVEYVCTIRSDFQFEGEDAVVKVTGLQHS